MKKVKDLRKSATRVILSDKYFVDIDAYNFTLHFRNENNTGYYRAGYFGNMKQALIGVKRHQERRADLGVIELDDYIKHLEGIEKRIKDMADTIVIVNKLSRKEIEDGE